MGTLFTGPPLHSPPGFINSISTRPLAGLFSTATSTCLCFCFAISRPLHLFRWINEQRRRSAKAKPKQSNYTHTAAARTTPFPSSRFAFGVFSVFLFRQPLCSTGGEMYNEWRDDPSSGAVKKRRHVADFSATTLSNSTANQRQIPISCP